MSKNRPLQGSLFASARSKLALYDGEDIPVRGVASPPGQHRVQDEKYDSIGSRRVISKVDEALTVVCTTRGYAEKDQKRKNFNYSDIPVYDDNDLYSADDTKGIFSRGSDLPDLSDDCEPDRWSRNSKDTKRIIQDSNDNRIGRLSSSENNATRMNRGIQMKLNVKPPVPALGKTCNAFKFNDDEEDDDVTNDNEVQILEERAESTKNMTDVSPVGTRHGRSDENRKYSDESYYSRITKQGHHEQSSVDEERYSENSNLTRSYDRYLEDRDPRTSSISPGNRNSGSRDLRSITRDEHRDSADSRSSSKDDHKGVDGTAEDILYAKYKSYVGNTRIALDRSPEHDPKKELSKTYRQNISPNHDKDRTDLYSREIESYKEVRDETSDKKYETYLMSTTDNNLTGESFRDCDELSEKLEKVHSAEVVIEYPINAAQGPPAEQYAAGYSSASFENYQLPSGGQSDQIFSEPNTGYNMYYESESINTRLQQNPLNYQSNWNQMQPPSYNYQDIMYQSSQFMPYQSQPAPYYPPRAVHQFTPRPQYTGHMSSNNQYTNRQTSFEQYVAATRDEDTSGRNTEALMSDPAVREELKQQNENLAKQRAVYYKKCADLYENLEDLKTEKQKLLKMKKSPDSDLLLKQNIHNQNDIQNKLKAVKNVIGMLTKIIEDNQSKSEERSPSHGHGNLLRRSPSLESDRKKHLNQRSKSPRKYYKDDKIRHEDSSKRNNEESFKRREDIERKQDEKKKDDNESVDKNDKIRDDFKFDREREHEVTTAKFDRERDHDDTTAKFDRERDHEVTTTKISEIENSSSINSQPNPGEVKSNEPWLKKSTKVVNNEKVLDLKPEEPEEVNYVYYDPEVHWCKICNLFPRTAKDYLNHLHTDEHKAKLKEKNISEFPWHKNITEVPPALPGLKMEKVPIRGLQFLMSVAAWYCKMCDEWIGDLHCASAHLKSKCHRSNYNAHNEKNPYWEVDWLSSRMRAYEDYVDMKNKTKQDMENTSSSTTSVDIEPDNNSTKLQVTLNDKSGDIEKPEVFKPEIVEKIEKERTNISGKPEKKRTTISGKSDLKDTKSKWEDRNRRTNLEEQSRHGKSDEGSKRRSDYRSKDYEKHKRDRSSRDLKRKSEERRRSRSVERKKHKNSDKRETNLNSDVEYDDSEKTDRLIEEWMAPINKNVDKEFSDLKSKLKNREVNKEKEKRKYREDDKECKISEPKDSSKPNEKKPEKSSSSTKNEVPDKDSNGKSDNSCTEENKTKIIFHSTAQKCKFPFIGKMPFTKNLKKNRILSKNENPEEKKTTLTGQDMSKIFKELEKNSELEGKNTEPVVLDNETRTKDFKETLSILFPGSSDNADKNDVDEIPIPSNIQIPRTVELFPTNCLPPQPQMSFPPSSTLPIPQNVPAPNILPSTLRFPHPNVSMNNPGFPPPNVLRPSSLPLMFMQPAPPPPVNIHHYREPDRLGFLTCDPVESHIFEKDNESNSAAENKTKKHAMSQKKRKRLQRIKQSEEELQLRINEAQKKLETNESSSSNTGELGLNEYMELELLGIDAEDSAFNAFVL